MHTCPPPVDVLEDWLNGVTVNPTQDYAHLLLEQSQNMEVDLVQGLKPYFESAHLDARDYFHAVARIDLHPDATDPSDHIQYPSCLPSNTLRGMFGEAMAGLISQSYTNSFVGQHNWSVPIFLFRFHNDVETYLFELKRDPERTREVLGRHGPDFLGLELDENGEVIRFILGEAKWRSSLNQSTLETLFQGPLVRGSDPPRRSGKGIWRSVNSEAPTPHGLHQMHQLLTEVAYDEYEAAILSLDRVIADTDGTPLSRTDLILVVGNTVPSRNPGQTYINQNQKPTEYTADNELQIVEIYLNNDSDLVQEIYSNLWQD